MFPTGTNLYDIPFPPPLFSHVLLFALEPPGSALSGGLLTVHRNEVTVELNQLILNKRQFRMQGE